MRNSTHKPARSSRAAASARPSKKKAIRGSTPSRPSKNGPRRGDVVAAPCGEDVPHWLPADHRWQEMPAEVRNAVSGILAPAYRRFVIDAPGELERSIGLTLVHLMWIEICDQAKMVVIAADPQSLDAILGRPDEMIERHLRLATVKCQTAELLLKLQAVHALLDSPPPSRLHLEETPAVTPVEPCDATSSDPVCDTNATRLCPSLPKTARSCRVRQAAAPERPTPNWKSDGLLPKSFASAES
ncbi:MAG: hypothetical protein ABFC63_08515 [Thermoguttaceae bacterium]